MTIDRLNYLVQRSYWVIKRFVLVLYATVTRKRFYCKALCGESTYSICINSDMTVSCNYQDYDGSGHIGDLHFENLDTIFASPKAVQFRNSLASGRLPIITCAACTELVISTPEDARHRAENWQVCSKGIMVENTVACPYRCKACPRSLLLQNRRSAHMTLDDVRKVSTIIYEHEIKIMHFLTGRTIFCL